jgi:hypothetical protein
MPGAHPSTNKPSHKCTAPATASNNKKRTKITIETFDPTQRCSMSNVGSMTNMIDEERTTGDVTGDDEVELDSEKEMENAEEELGRPQKYTNN